MEQLMSDKTYKEDDVKELMELGRMFERDRIIGMMEAALEAYPQLTLQDVIPLMLQKLYLIPAPQSFIDRNKAQMKLGLDDENFIKHMRSTLDES
jgi:hypothetical protein